jgi:hypothetical protein
VAIVVDSNLLIVMVNGDPRGEQVQMQFTRWIADAIDRNASGQGFSVRLLGES